jgi:hypothetical protein
MRWNPGPGPTCKSTVHGSQQTFPENEFCVVAQPLNKRTPKNQPHTPSMIMPNCDAVCSVSTGGYRTDDITVVTVSRRLE